MEKKRNTILHRYRRYCLCKLTNKFLSFTPQGEVKSRGQLEHWTFTITVNMGVLHFHCSCIHAGACRHAPAWICSFSTSVQTEAVKTYRAHAGFQGTDKLTHVVLWKRKKKEKTDQKYFVMINSICSGITLRTSALFLQKWIQYSLIGGILCVRHVQDAAPVHASENTEKLIILHL